MRFRLFPILLSTALSLAAAQGQEAPAREFAKASVHAGYFLKPGEFDLAGVLPPPPAAGSLPALADLETVLQVQRERSPADVAWARRVEKENVFDAASVLGPWFSPDRLPFTAQFLHQVFQDCHAIGERAKHLYARPRPPRTDPAVRPCVGLPTTTSYPSGHSMNAFVWAGVLGQIFPERRPELTAWAHRYAWGRIIGGVHFPSDDVGGRLLAEAILRELAKNPAFRSAVEKARAEARPYLPKKAA